MTIETMAVIPTDGGRMDLKKIKIIKNKKFALSYVFWR